MKWKIYVYDKCSTCRNALKFLDAQGVSYEKRAIRETPPSRDELREMLDLYDGKLSRLFNTSGMDYRAQGLKDKLPEMDVEEAFDLLQGNGNLVKRPFLIGKKKGIVGFKEAEWSALI